MVQKRQSFPLHNMAGAWTPLNDVHLRHGVSSGSASGKAVPEQRSSQEGRLLV